MPDHLGLLIGGKHVPAQDARTFASVSPVTGRPLAQVACAGPADADAAVDAAWTAFQSWSRTSYTERRRLLLCAADLLEARMDEHCDALALETGAVRRWGEMNIVEAAANLREAASLAGSPTGSLLPSHDPDTTNVDLRGPAGPVLAMVPWNAPVVLAARATAVALAAGNTVILRPSEAAPYAAGHLLAGTLTEAGLPDGVVNVLTCAPADSPALVTTLVQRPELRRVVFIGSTPVGRSIARLAGSHLTPAVMELGGKNVTVVLEDADPDRAAELIAVSAFANAGQVCMSTDRVLVAERLHADLAARLAARAEALTAGDPRSPGTDIGPLIDRRAADRFRDLVTDARAHGARVLAGGDDPEGLLARPTVLGGVGPAARLHQEEAFSPLVTVQPCASEEEMAARANDTPYGLIASVLSDDTARAVRLARRLRVGAVHVNGPSVGDEPHVPFGGVALSGFGRLGGQEAWHFFTEQKTLYVHGDA